MGSRGNSRGQNIRTTRRETIQIRWKGYSLAHDTWEPASNIHAPELVKAYLRRRQTRDKNPTMSNDDLPIHLNLLAMDPNTTSQPSTPPSPSSVTVFMEMAARARINVSEETAATVAAIQQQEEMTASIAKEPHDVPIPNLPHITRTLLPQNHPSHLGTPHLILFPTFFTQDLTLSTTARLAFPPICPRGPGRTDITFPKWLACCIA